MVALLQKKLPEPQQRLFGVVDIEPRSASEVNFRIPEIVVFDALWEAIRKVCTDNAIKCRRLSKFATLEELDLYLSAVKWLWTDWIPVGFITLLAGDPGGGKSMAALDWVRIMTMGEYWPNGEKCGKSLPAVWVEAESSQKLLNDRSKCLGLPRNLVYLPAFGNDILGQPDLNDEAHQSQLIQLVQSRKPGMVVVDSLGGANAGGENKIEEVRPLLSFLANMARDEDVAVLLIHHFKKGYGKDDMMTALYRVRGSSAIAAFSRSIITLEKLNDGALLQPIKSNLGPLAKPLKMALEFCEDGRSVKRVTYSPWTPPAPKRTKKEHAAEWLWEYLKEHGRTALPVIVDAGEGQGYTRVMLYTARDVLINQIQVDGTGREAYWSIATDMESVDAVLDAHDGD